jgi:hypothetical protein
VPQEKNFALLANRSFMHAYFMRLFEADGELLVNHHSCLRQTTEFNRPITYAAPFKKVVFDADGTLRLKWFEGNGGLYGEPTDTLSGDVIIEGRLKSGGALTLRTDGGGIRISVADNGTVVYAGLRGDILEECQ